MIKTYSELRMLHSFKERFEYLKLDGSVGESTFGFDRFINQEFYNSSQWKSIRDQIIIRDNGCDLGMEGHDIYGKIFIHHMNPISVEDILENSEFLLNPEYLICTTLATHNAIHYSNENLLIEMPFERRRNDMCPWRK